ncbi:hypothetical protein K438DRAFT_1991116 [Mycena galopus ATCC 62051]|nr:hypothetical protein K438DRAFT_1991116 [Mycena galopus ATCC 62051]
MSMLTVSVGVHGQPEVTFQVPLSEDAHQMTGIMQKLSININDAQSLVHVEMHARVSEPLLFPDPKARVRYETLKTMASTYGSNLRSLEEHWRTLFTELLRVILPGHVIMQEEGTLWTYHDTTRNPAATTTPLDRTLALGRGSGYSMRPDFRAIVSRNDRIYSPILGESKKAISRQHTAPSGWPATRHGHNSFTSSMQRAITQVELQAVVLFKLDRHAPDTETRQSKVCLIATVGPIYVMALATREQIEDAYPDANLDQVNDRINELEAQEERARQIDPPAPASLDAMLAESDTFVQDEYAKHHSKLPTRSWSAPCMLDTPESDALLFTIRGWPYLEV